MTRDRTIHFNCIPKSSALFLDYLYDFPKVQSFFSTPYALENLRKESPSLSSFELPHRQELCQILESQNLSFGAGERTLENLERLKEEDCCAVVTGQQVGLFTGPAYTVYKALTTVKLCANYACRGIKAVPIFWMATEDHDIAEVDHCFLLDAESQLRQVRYEAGLDDVSRPVGQVVFSNGIETPVRQFLEALPNSEFRQEFETKLSSCYVEGKSLASAFGELFSFLFSNYGLILVDPQDWRLKQLMKPASEKILQHSRRYRSLLISQSQKLRAAGYHNQVVLEEDSASGLFLEEDGKRKALILEGELYRIKGNENTISGGELQETLKQSPWRFSPNVLFRPVFQDFLLPTLVYVAGPSEIAYLAQMGPLYEEFDRKQPIVFPRFSISIIEKKIAKILEKYHLNFCDIFLGREALIKKVVEQTLDRTTTLKFEQIENEFVQRMAELESPLKTVDQTLGEALKTAQEKIRYHVSHLRTKFVHAEAKHQEVLTKQIDKAQSILYPLKSPQERRINIFYFLSRYGMDFLAHLYEEIDLTDPDHRLIFLN